MEHSIWQLDKNGQPEAVKDLCEEHSLYYHMGGTLDHQWFGEDTD